MCHMRIEMFRQRYALKVADSSLLQQTIYPLLSMLSHQLMIQLYQLLISIPEDITYVRVELSHHTFDVFTCGVAVRFGREDELDAVLEGE